MKKAKYGRHLKISKIKILQNNPKEENNFENKSNKIENNTETESAQVNKENKSIDDTQIEIKFRKQIKF